MTTTGTGMTTTRDVLDAVHRLAPAMAARAGETEAARRVPRDLLDGLTAAGVFRLLRPPVARRRRRRPAGRPRGLRGARAGGRVRRLDRS